MLCDEYKKLTEYNDDTLTKEDCKLVKSSKVSEKCVFKEETNNCKSIILSCSIHTGNKLKICRLFWG